MSRCRCADIRRADRELAHCATGSACVSETQSNAGSEGRRLPTASSTVFAGAYSINGNAIADAIDALIKPVNRCVATAQSDFSNAQTRIANLRAAMQLEDTIFHQAEAARLAAKAAALSE